MIRTDEEWEKVGVAWRIDASMNDIDRIDPHAFLRRLKYSGVIKDYAFVPDDDLRGAKGKYDPFEEKIYIRKSISEYATLGDGPSVFAIVHECCHAILGHKQVRAKAINPLARKLGWNADEKETDRLTACILAPFHRSNFEPGMTAADISRKFGLSLPAAEIRRQEFERMYRRKHGIKRELPPGVYDFLLSAKRSGHKITSIDNSALMPSRPITRYEGDACPNPKCKQFKLFRLGLRMKCDSCGTETGED